ncbi:MAG: TetR/AcrR family transcriptional regulator [Sandaracinaceae bacterium]
MDGAYQRARSPAQKAERAERILAAARSLLEAKPDSSALSLNELARRAGMAKSNVYRYFESREAVLLALLADQAAAWGRQVVEGLARMDTGEAVDARLARMAALLAGTAARRPLLCHLLSVLPSVLEHNVSFATVRRFKADNHERMTHLARAMHRALPELTVEQHGELLHHGTPLIIGSWPLAHPAEVVREVMQSGALPGPGHRFEDDLRRAFVLLGRGMLGDQG